ncbi:MAG TPA: hypothetical protein VFM80_05705 [Gracilimonas sp.]|uniref:LEM-3-like GIY-YIG domain-containing protein n=1 Tax=Gracilimonas sp. TaxID=1974203 RepID=UPI002DB0FA03|nr:hypothetical protein [Gracilimonas sp.]
MEYKFSSTVIKELKYYVYIYSHPLTEEIFYVGKGKGNRVFSHLNDKNETQKVELIQEIRGQGLEPKIEILIHGLDDEKTALRVESSIIDLIDIKNLTNEYSGYKSATFGRMSIAQINATYEKEEVEIEEPSILIRINQAFRYSMEEVELYDYTRGQWKINPKRAEDVKYAFAVYKGVIQEIYTVINWYKAGNTFSVRRDNKFIEREKEERLEGRYEFIGNIASDEIRKKYKFKSVAHYFKEGNSNPIMYLNV